MIRHFSPLHYFIFTPFSPPLLAFDIARFSLRRRYLRFRHAASALLRARFARARDAARAARSALACYFALSILRHYADYFARCRHAAADFRFSLFRAAFIRRCFFAIFRRYFAD